MYRFCALRAALEPPVSSDSVGANVGTANMAITRRLPFSSSAEVLKFAEFVIDQSLPVGR